MKNYATETDIITNPDPLYYRGDRVKWVRNERLSELGLFVESVCWNALQNSWEYTLAFFLTEDDGFHKRWNGAWAGEALEKQLKLVTRRPRK
jgi:hypothetical protein